MTQKEKLETLTGAKMPEPTKQEIHKEQIHGTPFWIFGKENEYHLIMGKYKLNPTTFHTKQDLLEWWNKNTWNIQMSMTIAIVTDILNNQNKQ